jgi:hypothetical protein
MVDFVGCLVDQRFESLRRIEARQRDNLATVGDALRRLDLERILQLDY